ncbi:type 1 glutamine amidotransferase domain-containing protein [Thalassotalea litorea]|uniref:Type 1 glutamine amidotransferase domain-containing protein n=1 Tax=Thalassotalea litorea TaxID=2020715 RepID=A0A5R9ILX2_9GAMM|nr:type 1 glutamine amidotransferase domain-containing protein [Thalassotalea litorea]TLU61019.1 type 1 glutamine amidotransferase domain-containing protein [Thalassotalea litorea]
MLKKLFITLGIVVSIIGISTVSGYYWLKGVIPKQDYAALKASKAQDIPYLQQQITPSRGKILAVVTSIDTMGESGKSTGYELTELARAYWVFSINGYEVDIASTEGGKPPVVIDGDDMGAFDYAFLNDDIAQQKVANSLHIDNVSSEDYQAVYFVGGKGAMFDFPDNHALQQLVKELFQQDKVIAAVCHGPAALVNVRLDNGEFLIANKQMSAFTNEEELFLIPNAEQIFPFLLESKLLENGADFEGGTAYLEQVSRDGNLITGQNPWSVWPLAEEIIIALGHKPVPRLPTNEETSIALLGSYEQNGFHYSKQRILNSSENYQTTLVLMHGILAMMKFEIRKGIELMRLADLISDQQT